MILVLENMDIQDIVLFNYGDTINGTSLHSTRIPFHPGLQSLWIYHNPVTIFRAGSGKSFY